MNKAPYEKGREECMGMKEIVDLVLRELEGVVPLGGEVVFSLSLTFEGKKMDGTIQFSCQQTYGEES